MYRYKKIENRSVSLRTAVPLLCCIGGTSSINICTLAGWRNRLMRWTECKFEVLIHIQMIQELLLKMRMHVLLLLMQNIVFAWAVLFWASSVIQIANHKVAHRLVEVWTFKDVSIVWWSDDDVSLSYCRWLSYSWGTEIQNLSQTMWIRFVRRATFFRTFIERRPIPRYFLLSLRHMCHQEGSC